jgi:hypothetical protein
VYITSIQKYILKVESTFLVWRFYPNKNFWILMKKSDLSHQPPFPPRAHGFLPLSGEESVLEVY